MALLPVRKNPKNGFTVVTVHYSSDPDKLSKEWLLEAHRGMTDRAWQREYEIDYTSFAGKAYYPEFQQYNIAPQEIQYQSGETLYRGFDYGFHRPCCVITKLNEKDQWVILKVILGQDEGIMTFGKRIKNFCLANYPGARYIDAADIAGLQVSDKGELSSMQILNSIGIYPQSRKQPIKMGAEIIRQKLLMRVDGQPGLLINPSQQYAIDAFKGGLHYPEPREGQPEREFYEKDGFFDHCFSPFTNILLRNGTKNISEVVSGDEVLVRGGFRRVTWSKKTGIKQAVLYVFSNGSHLIATPDHRIYVKGKGFVSLEKVGYSDTIEVCTILIDQTVRANRSFMTVIDLIGILSQRITHLEATLSAQTSKKDFIFIFGRSITVHFLKVIRFIIGTAIHLIIGLKIWLWYLGNRISNFMQHNGEKTPQHRNETMKISDLLGRLQKNGTRVRRVVNGIGDMERMFGKMHDFTKKNVRFVVKNIRRIFPKNRNIVQTIVSQQQPEESVRLLWKSPIVLKIPTYNLHIAEQHEYFANGLLVHNCGDALRYIAVELFTIIGQQQERNMISDNASERLYAMGSPNTSSDLWGSAEYEDEGGLNDYF